MVGNGTISYDHERDGRPTELGGCNAMVRNLKHDTFLFIRYVRRRLTVRSAGDAPREHHSLLIVSFDKYFEGEAYQSFTSAATVSVQVMIDIDGQHEWRDCLDIPGVRLPQGYYFGASAITGDLSGKTFSHSLE